MNELGKRTITSIIFVSTILGVFFINQLAFSLLLLGILVYILIYEWPKLLSPKKWYFYLITIPYPIFPVLGLILLNTYNRKAVLFCFVVTWACDTGSYILGKSFGVNKICPSISPGKSWEGLFGGFLSVFFTIFIFTKYGFINMMSFSKAIIFTGLLTTFGFLGDIFVSYLKRKAHLKDTGNILPGHGGFLDRLDSIFFVVFIVIFFLFKSF